MDGAVHAGYVVLRQGAEGEWRVVGEVDRHPGLPARRSRTRAVRNALGREPGPDEVFAVVPRSEWGNALDN